MHSEAHPRAFQSARKLKEHRRAIHLIARHGAIVEPAPDERPVANLCVMRYRSPAHAMRMGSHRLRAGAMQRGQRSIVKLTTAALASPLVWFAHALYAKFQPH